MVFIPEFTMPLLKLLPFKEKLQGTAVIMALTFKFKLFVYISYSLLFACLVKTASWFVWTFSYPNPKVITEEDI